MIFERKISEKFFNMKMYHITYIHTYIRSLVRIYVHAFIKELFNVSDQIEAVGMKCYDVFFN